MHTALIVSLGLVAIIIALIMIANKSENFKSQTPNQVREGYVDPANPDVLLVETQLDPNAYYYKGTLKTKSV